MCNLPSPDALVSRVADISRADRWMTCRRLQELGICCWCPADGSLWVEIDRAVDVMLLCSTVQQLIAPRQELVKWLDRCWHAQLPLTSKVCNSLEMGRSPAPID